MTIPINITEKRIIVSENDEAVEPKKVTRAKDDFTFQIRDNKAQRKRDSDTYYTRSEEVQIENKNKFVDDGYDKDSPEVIEKLYPKKRAPRRDKHTNVTIDCRECNKEYSIHPMHVRGSKNNKYYICDKCLVGKRG